ncbi:Trehalase [Aphelenchoides fujianensis]|nr:Trehalase [Aphelenchoides fujianensis]
MRDQIYCSGSLLDAVQKAHIFEDCKEFVDMPMKHSAETVLTNWNILWAAASQDGAISKEVLMAFIEEHFDAPGNELEECAPEDWNQDQTFDRIADPTYRQFAAELHRIWPTLMRKVRAEVHENPERYSILPLSKPFGLLLSGMFTTVRGMIENMCHLIKTYGHIYNGNRVYYKNRSQPPLLTWCVKSYFDATNDLEFNKRIQKEGWTSYLFRFFVVADGPRPESYREDIETAEHLQDNDAKNRLYGDICAAAESGRDFSGRWFASDGDHAGRMKSCRTSEIAPVELNSIIARNMRLFSEFYALLGDQQQSERYRLEYEVLRKAIHEIFWNEELGAWFCVELLFLCAHDGFDAKRVVDYLDSVGALQAPGGLPTSMKNTVDPQQWDAPNGWAPTNWIAVKGLAAYGQMDVARSIATKWIQRNFVLFQSSGGKMFEKYNVMDTCLNSKGGAGEYECQTGFGWSNATVMDMLHIRSPARAAADRPPWSRRPSRRPRPLPTIPEIVVEQLAAVNIMEELINEAPVTVPLVPAI